MSFDFGPMNNLSNVQASAKTCAGGGGNTGYFQRGKQEEEEPDIGFAKDYPEDSFEKDVQLDDVQEQGILEIIKGLILDFIEAVKGLFIK